MSNMPAHFTPPPRRVPLSLVVTNLFGGFSQFGWVFFGFGMIFVWAFGGSADMSFVTFRGALERAKGRVTHVETTGASENKRPVVANHYEYSVAGRLFEGVSYTTGDSASEGQAVTVEYKPDAPEKSRIEGMRRGQFGPVVWFVAIFPLIGLAFIVGTFGYGRKRNHVLRHGILTTGRLIKREATNVTVNKRRVWALTFAFTGRDGRQHEAVARSSFPDRLMDEAQEPLLYDPNDPSRAYVLDELPSRPSLDMTGELRGRPIAALLALIIPLLVIAGHGFVLLKKLGLV